MDTTIMRDSIVGDAWIKEVCASNPASILPGDARYISTGPCRLAFCDTLWTPKAPMNQPNATPKFGTTALYTPYTDMNVFYGEYWRLCRDKFPEYWNKDLNGGQGGYVGLEVPFHDQANKSHKFSGYTPGCMYINHTSKFKPAIVDANQNPVTDPSLIYPGVWAILVVNAYDYGKSPPQPKKGVSFGIAAVMLIGNDKSLSGGGVDAKQVFSGVHVKPPAVAPGALAGMVPPAPGGQPPFSGPPMVGYQSPASAGGMPPPPPQSPSHAAMAGMPPADDDMDISGMV